MAKLSRARTAGKVAKGHSLRRRGMSLEAKNEFLANQIANAVFSKQTEPLKVDKDGVVVNVDYSNSENRRWLED
ncbi:hypothetical protein [Bacillus infantis]|uniref:hypothetical protein n=1 Tax=Bacillus infantis TaxID=324767 RepID=UPI003CFAAB0B